MYGRSMRIYGRSVRVQVRSEGVYGDMEEECEWV